MHTQWIKIVSVSVLLIVSLPVIADRPLQPPLSHTLTQLKNPFKAKAFTLQNADDDTVKFSTYRGKVVVLNFWATWCPPCAREMPSLQRLYLQLKSNKFGVIAIDQMEDDDQVFAFTGQLSLTPTFNVLLDKDSKVANSYGIRGLPTTYIIDKKGMVRYRAIGGREFDHPQIKKIIQQLIAE